MKMALKDGIIYVIELDSIQVAVIKSWGNALRYDRKKKWYYGPATGELLNRLSEMRKLPDNIEAERQRINAIQAAVDEERMKEKTEPLYPYPLKIKPFQHQTKAMNMCMYVFGFLQPGSDVSQKK